MQVVILLLPLSAFASSFVNAERPDAYARIWREVASHNQGRASIVGYDLACKLYPDEEAEQPLGDWNALAKRITAAICEVEKDKQFIEGK